MKTPNDNNLDRLFREGLAGSDGKAEFREEDWAAMEDLLDNEQSKKPGIIWLYWLAGSVAAIFLLFFGWELLNPVVPATHQTAKVPVKKALPADQNKANEIADRQKNSNKNSIAEAGKTQETEINNLPDKRSITSSFAKTSKHSTQLAEKIAFKRSISTHVDSALISDKLASNPIDYRKKINPNIDEGNVDAKNSTTDRQTIELKATPLIAVNADQDLVNTADVKFDTSFIGKKSALKNAAVIAKSNKIVRQGAGFRPQIALAILTAPDVNGVSSLAGSKVGTNAGVQLNVQFSKRWSINAGAAYAVKPYEIYGADYSNSGYTPPSAITSVNADCRVLDIPINLNYQFYSNQKNAFSIGSGLSSYFMLREHYQFNYANNTEWNYNLANQNKHVLSVLNLNATYQRQVSQKFNVIAQPYFKLPLKGVGYERINLQSAGIAIGVGWNLGSFKIK
jgi:hypothetical protein